MDRKLDDCKPNPKPQLVASNRTETPLLAKDSEGSKSIDDDGRTYERVQKLRNTRDAYIITVVSKRCIISIYNRFLSERSQ